MKKIFLLICFIFIFKVGNAQNNEEFKKDVLKAIELTGTTFQMSIVRDQALKIIPKEKREEFIKEFDATLPKFYENMAKVFMEIYTQEDIKAMITFYQSPTGKKIKSNALLISEKSQVSGQEWRKIVQEIVAKYSGMNYN